MTDAGYVVCQTHSLLLEAGGDCPACRGTTPTPYECAHEVAIVEVGR
jgi:hypothetical protein